MNIEDIRNTIREYVRGIIGDKLAAGINDDSSIIQSRLLDSVNTLQMVAFLEEKYGIEISAHEIMDENFDSVNKISDFVLSKKNS